MTLQLHQDPFMMQPSLIPSSAGSISSNNSSSTMHEAAATMTTTTMMTEAASSASLSVGIPKSPPQPPSPSSSPSQESERNRRLAIRIRITPCIYLKCTPERKQDERLALAAMLGMDQHTHRREEVISAVVFHCPSIFRNTTAMLELFVQGDVHGVEDIIMRMCTNIAWDCDLAITAIHRTPVTFRYLPKFLQTHLDVIHTLLDNPSGGLYLGRCAPRALLISHSALVLRALKCGFSRSDIPLELLMSKEFIVQAVAVDSYILTECSLGMISDWDVLMAAATSNHCNALSLVEASLRKCRINPKRVLTPFAEHVKARLDRHLAFQTFLSGISIQRPGTTLSSSSSSIPLQALNCGEETSTALKRHIAEYSGDVVDYQEILKYKKAWKCQVARYYHTHIRAEDGSLIIPNNSYHDDPEEEMDSLLPIGRFLRWGGGLTLDRKNVPNTAATANNNSRSRHQRRRSGRRRGLRVLRHVQIALGMKDASDRHSDASDNSSDSESDNDGGNSNVSNVAPPPWRR